MILKWAFSHSSVKSEDKQVSLLGCRWVNYIRPSVSWLFLYLCPPKKIRNLGRLLTLLGSSSFTDQWLSNAQKNTIFIMGASLKWQHRNIIDLRKHRRQYNDLQDGTELVGRGYGRDWRLGPRPQPTCLQVLLAHCLHKSSQIRQKDPGIE